MKARTIAGLGLLALAIGGCHKGSRSLVGDWDLYTPMMAGVTGTMSFSDTVFSQHVNAGSWLKQAKDATGAYHLAADELELDGAITTSAAPFKVEWESDDLVYLTQETSGSKLVYALVRNGAQPDAKRLTLSIDTSKVKGGQAQWSVVRGDQGSSAASMKPAIGQPGAVTQNAPQQASFTAAPGEPQPTTPQGPDADPPQQQQQQQQPQPRPQEQPQSQPQQAPEPTNEPGPQPQLPAEPAPSPDPSQIPPQSPGGNA